MLPAIEQIVKSTVTEHLKQLAQNNSGSNKSGDSQTTNDEQIQAYDDLNIKLDDPGFKLDDPGFREALNYQSLVSSDEMKNLSQELQKKILIRVVGMVNNGEINENFFTSYLITL